MIQSMTGFGRAQIENEHVSVSVEVKSLNSKSADISTRMSHLFSDKEIEVRNMLSAQLQRGKIMISINYASKGGDAVKASLNQSLVKAYYDELLQTAKLVGKTHTEDLFGIVMNLPDVYTKETDEDVLERDWGYVRQAVQEAIDRCGQFRTEEGAALEVALRECVQSIADNLQTVEQLDPTRVSKVRERLHAQLKEIWEDESYDKNRFEQELVFYIEKLDIAEEKVRLRNHLQYFGQTLELPASNGKKLGFIAQEIGREINTIGSKANDADIQRYVVNMKEELEKIKEQLMNVL